MLTKPDDTKVAPGPAPNEDLMALLGTLGDIAAIIRNAGNASWDAVPEVLTGRFGAKLAAVGVADIKSGFLLIAGRDDKGPIDSLEKRIPPMITTRACETGLYAVIRGSPRTVVLPLPVRSADRRLVAILQPSIERDRKVEGAFFETLSVLLSDVDRRVSGGSQ